MIQPPPATAFTLAADFDVHDLPGRVGGGFILLEAEKEQIDEEYLDTFDWLLYLSGMLLARTKRRYRLYSGTGEILCQGWGPRRLRPFWEEFPVGQLQDELRSTAGIRALCPQLQLKGSRQYFHLLNEDEKIVLRLRQDLTTVHLPGREPSLVASLHLFGVRGYERPFQAVSEIVGQNGGQQATEGSMFLRPVLDAAGISPERMGAKFAVALDRDCTVFEGLREIGLVLLAEIGMQLPGVIEDIDSEFLHDFRIALRRTRSLLSLFFKTLPREQAEHFRAELKWITQATNSVRDCDVYLLGADEYRAMLPERLHPGLLCFFEGLRERRKKEFKLMKRRLKSARAAALFKDWQGFLRDRLPALPPAKKPGLCRGFAARLLKKRYKRILETGAACGPESEDTVLHALRIEAKKLRYLLEFFRSVLAAAEVDQLVKHLKRLQNNLGEFNDLSVQQAMLGSFQSPVKTGNIEQMLGTAAALGGLIAHLADRQRLVRSEFEETFLEFAGEDNQTLVRTIVTDAFSGLPGEKDPSSA